MDGKRSILITGCSSGIGRCLARGLAGRGYQVFATARRSSDVESLAAEGLSSLQLDLDDSVSIREAVAEVLCRTGAELYGLVNNGSYGLYGAVEDLSRETLRRQFETNLFGTHELTSLLLPVFRRQRRGRIVQIGSVLGFAPIPFRGAYNASKHALEGLSDTLRLELWGSGIHLSIVQPGPIATGFRDSALGAMERELDLDNSIHAEVYDALRPQLQGPGDPPFTLPPEAVLKKVIKALEVRRPKARYPVTVPSHAFSWCRRLCPGWLLDRLLLIAGGGGRRE